MAEWVAAFEMGERMRLPEELIELFAKYIEIY